MDVTNSALTQFENFGDNPGSLRMYAYVPDDVVDPPLVVALHGCTQTAVAYESGTGWCELARRYGFAVLMPEQRRSNNGNNCFNWFSRGDVTREQGEAASIKQMIDHLVTTHAIDPARIYVTGLSAGGAMTVSMLASYPEVFAAGAVVAGLAHGAGYSLQEALSAMYRGSGRDAGALADAVRSASPDTVKTWPRISVWHGLADRTVNPINGDEVVTQWLQLNDFPELPMSQIQLDGAQRQVWWDADGRTVVESVRVDDLAHGTPIGIGGDDISYGTAGPHVFASAISSTWNIAEFFELVGSSAPMQVKRKPSADIKRVV